MPTATLLEPKTMFIECMSHGVTGIGAWKELAEPMFKAVRARFESSFATDHRVKYLRHDATVDTGLTPPPETLTANRTPPRRTCRSSLSSYSE